MRADYSGLRGEALDAIEFHDMYVSVIPEAMIEILDEIDALRAQITPAKPKRGDYPADFMLAYRAVAWRSGSTPAAAYRSWSARIAAGATPSEMQMGAEKYGRYCTATGCEVKQAQTFFGPGEHFTADWTIQAAAQKGKSNGQIGKQDYSAGVQDDGSF